MTGDQSISQRLSLAASNRGAKKSRRWLWIVGGTVVVLVGAVFFLLQPKTTSYITQSVIHGVLTESVSATGTIAPEYQVEVGAEVSGRIDDLYVDYNDYVTKGQKLAKINTDQLEAQLQQVRATLAQSKATLAQTEAVLKRDEALLKINALSPQQYDTARGDYLRAKAGVAQSRAQVANYETQLAKATIYAPIDGVVLDRKVSRGQTVVAAMTTPVLFTLASDLSRMELDVDIDEADVGSVRSGQMATFTVDAYAGRNFSARLVKIHNAPQTVNNVVTYKGVLIVDNHEHLLKPGMTATSEIITGRSKDVILIPNVALRYVPPEAATKNARPAPVGANLGRVWTQRGRTLMPHDLKLGGTDGRFTQMRAGDLKAGDALVTETKAATP